MTIAVVSAALEGCDRLPESCVEDFGAASDEGPVTLESQLTEGVYALVEVGDVRIKDDPAEAVVNVREVLWATERGGPEWVPPPPSTERLAITDRGCRWEDVEDALDDGKRIVVSIGSGSDRRSYAVRHPVVMIAADEFSFIPEASDRVEQLSLVTKALGKKPSTSNLLGTLIDWNDEINGSDRTDVVRQAWREVAEERP